MIVDRYYYHQLNKKEQAVYRAFYDGVMDRKDIIPIPIKGKISQETFNKVFFAVTRDNPLIYYLNQSACSMAQDIFGHTAICPQYFFSEDKIKEYNKKIENCVNSLAQTLRLTEGTDYEKEKKVHDWLCENIKYDYQGSDINDVTSIITSHNIIGVFAHHKAQCEGIAKAVKVLLNSVDVRCIVATGNGTEDGQSEPHAWNVVNLDGMPYQLDVTWDIGDGQSNTDMGIRYDYFNLNDKLMGKNHQADSKLPECKNLDDNYFEKNNLVFKNRTKLYSYIEKQLKNGKKELYFRIEGKSVNSIQREVVNYITKTLRELGIRSLKIRQSANELLGICWIRIE